MAAAPSQGRAALQTGRQTGRQRARHELINYFRFPSFLINPSQAVRLLREQNGLLSDLKAYHTITQNSVFILCSARLKSA